MILFNINIETILIVLVLGHLLTGALILAYTRQQKRSQAVNIFDFKVAAAGRMGYVRGKKHYAQHGFGSCRQFHPFYRRGSGADCAYDSKKQLYSNGKTVLYRLASLLYYYICCGNSIWLSGERQDYACLLDHSHINDIPRI